MFNKLDSGIKSINNFNNIYLMQKCILESNQELYDARFVEQWYYYYDSRLAGNKCDVIDNLKLYHLRNVERTDITHLNLHYAKTFNNKIYYFIVYREKGEMYVEMLAGGMALKTFFTSWIDGKKFKVKQKIDVEYY